MDFGMTPMMSMTSTPSPKKSPLAEKGPREEHFALPVTIKSLQEGHFQDGKTTIFNLPAPKVIVVGVVEEANEQATNSEYTLNDYTGTLKVQSYQTYIEEKPAKGDIIRVVGEPRQDGLSVINLAVLTDPVALGFHRLQATMAQCEATSPARSLDFTPVKTEAPTTVAPTLVKAEPILTQLSGADLTKQIKAEVKSCRIAVPKGEEIQGALIQDIVNACAKYSTASDVRSAIQNLVDGGDLFNTLTEEYVELSEEM